MKVKATGESKRRRIRIAELHRVVEPGFVFDVTPERFKVLSGNNRFGAKFVELVEEPFFGEPLPTAEPKVEEFTMPVTEPVVPTPHIEIQPIEPVTDEEPEIYVIEPGKEPVRVDEALKPIEEKVEEPVEEAPKKKRGRKKKEEVEVSE